MGRHRGSTADDSADEDMGFAIGGVRIPNPLVLAPMAGVCDRAFREIVKGMGCGLVCTEMVSDKALLYSHPKTMSMIEIGAAEHPVSVQLLGSEPEFMARAAQVLARAGADLIDINMGCPARKVIRNGEGAALMRDPHLAEEIVAAVVGAQPLPVTVKMRARWESGGVGAPELALKVCRAGAAAVTVHGRTVEQGYAGKADWRVIRDVVSTVGVPVIGNGDVRCGDDAVRMLETTGCRGVMIGRGCLGNPWIFAEALAAIEGRPRPDPPGPYERASMALAHLEGLLRIKTERAAVLEMRKHVPWYLKGLPGASRLREKANAARTAEEMRSLLKDFRAAAEPAGGGKG